MSFETIIVRRYGRFKIDSHIDKYRKLLIKQRVSFSEEDTVFYDVYGEPLPATKFKSIGENK